MREPAPSRAQGLEAVGQRAPRRAAVQGARADPNPNPIPNPNPNAKLCKALEPYDARTAERVNAMIADGVVPVQLSKVDVATGKVGLAVRLRVRDRVRVRVRRR